MKLMCVVTISAMVEDKLLITSGYGARAQVPRLRLTQQFKIISFPFHAQATLDFRFK